MFVFGNLLQTVAYVISAILNIYWWIVFARIVLSWINPNPMNDLIRGVLRFVYQVTDPVLYKIRKALPFMVTGGIDLSPIALFIAIKAVDLFLTNTLLELAHRMN